MSQNACDPRQFRLSPRHRAITGPRYLPIKSTAQGDIAYESTIEALSSTYIRCATDASSEFFAIGAAMTGNEERARIYRELVDTGVHMFEAVPRPHVRMPDLELKRFCIALVGAGESLSASVLEGVSTEDEAIATYSQLIGQAMSRSLAD